MVEHTVGPQEHLILLRKWLLRKWLRPWDGTPVYAALGTSVTSYPRLLRRWTSLAVDRLRVTWSR